MSLLSIHIIAKCRVASCQLLAFGFRLSASGFQLPAAGFGLLATGYWLPALGYRLPAKIPTFDIYLGSRFPIFS